MARSSQQARCDAPKYGDEIDTSFRRTLGNITPTAPHNWRYEDRLQEPAKEPTIWRRRRKPARQGLLEDRGHATLSTRRNDATNWRGVIRDNRGRKTATIQAESCRSHRQGGVEDA